MFFSQSLSDVHCGLKILHRSVIEKIKLSVNDFGIEIDIASQIVRNNFFIYEFGVSYFFRSKAQGKKISDDLEAQWSRCLRKQARRR